MNGLTSGRDGDGGRAGSAAPPHPPPLHPFPHPIPSSYLISPTIKFILKLTTNVTNVTLSTPP